MVSTAVGGGGMETVGLMAELVLLMTDTGSRPRPPGISVPLSLRLEP